MSKRPVWPGALYDHLKYQASLFPGLPLLIVENGSVDVADNVDRATYIREHVRQVQHAVKDGVNLMGYICWAITSNREWGLPFDQSSDFGLYHIDLDSRPAARAHPDVCCSGLSRDHNPARDVTFAHSRLMW